MSNQNTYSFKAATGDIIRVNRDRKKAQDMVNDFFGKGKYNVFQTSLGVKTFKEYTKGLV